MMFWKRWFGYESLKLDSAPMWPVDVGKPVISKLKTEIISLKSQLEYQTHLARSFRDRVHELEKQVQELRAAHENCERVAIDRLKKLLAIDLVVNPRPTTGGSDVKADSVGEETESDADSHLPTLSSLAGIGLASNDGEETQVFDSRQYGEQ